jgi:hypothetical protein
MHASIPWRTYIHAYIDQQVSKISSIAAHIFTDEQLFLKPRVWQTYVPCAFSLVVTVCAALLARDAWRVPYS